MRRTPASKLPPLPPKEEVHSDIAWGCFFAFGAVVLAWMGFFLVVAHCTG